MGKAYFHSIGNRQQRLWSQHIFFWIHCGRGHGVLLYLAGVEVVLRLSRVVRVFIGVGWVAGAWRCAEPHPVVPQNLGPDQKSLAPRFPR
jgi:hypothetical protein